ncbi:MAG: TIGR02391 family protein [Thermoanaerobaculia bacterium]
MAYLSINELLPDGGAILAMMPEELGPYVLEFLNNTSGNMLNRYNFGLPHVVEKYPRPVQPKISEALIEAWMWLEREGFLAPQPGDSQNWYFITRRGKALKTHVDVEAFKRADRLPRGELHPRIAEKVWPAYLRGDYETAVFQSFKEVEVCVREHSNLAATDVGTALMRKAFKTGDGSLTDTSLPEAEQEATAHLFAGAIGRYKNPSSHRNVDMTDATVAMELLVFASHLLRIVEPA